MDPQTRDAQASRARLRGAAVLRRELLQEAEEDRLTEQHAHPPRRWPLVLALLALLLILPAFYFVVSDAMAHSTWRQQAQADHAAALGHCNSLPGRDGGGPCQLRANAEAGRAAQARSPEAR